MINGVCGGDWGVDVGVCLKGVAIMTFAFILFIKTPRFVDVEEEGCTAFMY